MAARTERRNDFAPSVAVPELEHNLRLTASERLDEAEAELRRLGRSPERATKLGFDASELKWFRPVELFAILAPAGTNGYDDLCRKAIREPLGFGVRTMLASLDDIIRATVAHGGKTAETQLPRLHRLLDLAQTIGPDPEKFPLNDPRHPLTDARYGRTPRCAVRIQRRANKRA